MTLTPQWLQDFLRRPSRADLVARVKRLTEERDAFEERVYDNRWHLDRARNELAGVRLEHQAELAAIEKLRKKRSLRVPA